MSDKADTAVAPLRGMATVSFWADDVPAAVDWYTRVLGTDPYFVRPEPPAPPMYVEYRLGDNHDELGIIDRRFAPPGGEASAGSTPGGVVTYWHVDDVRGTFQQLLDAGATSYEPPTDREAGFVTAAVLDPFGNILGVMYNPNWLEHSATR
jgi:catechol 2,3-dioxygenase-like lactoylglutathione lyase family enzyme